MTEPKAPPDVALPSFGQWTVGGKLTITRTPTGFRLAVPENADWGHVWVEGEADLDTTPYLSLWITEVGRDARWLLTANDPDVKSLEKSSEDVGRAAYDLREKTGWHGRKRFRLYLTVQGRGKYIEVAGAGFFRQKPIPGDRPVRWTRMNGAITTYLPNTSTNSIALKTSADQWGGLFTHLPLDVDHFPIVEATVTGLAPGTRWRVALAGVASGPEQRNNGTIAFNYRDFTAWRGLSNVDIQVVFMRTGGGAAGTVTNVRFVPYPTASSPLVDKARNIKVQTGTGTPLLKVGAFGLTYDRAARIFRLERPGGKAALVSRFLEMPGFDITPSVPPSAKTTATGKRIEYTRESEGAVFTVTAETMTNSPGLLHTRVTIKPNWELRLSSCGQEWAYVPLESHSNSYSSPAPVLHRWATQNLCATALCYATAPGMGRVLYWQNLTALNPLFDACGMVPRWLVSAGDRTFGFANPLDNGHLFKSGETFTLSDSYLYLTAETDGVGSGNNPDTDPVSVADGLLKGMAAVYNALPDKPETGWMDWPDLAETSLQDLLNDDCWREYNGKLYLQSYVGTHGSSPMMAATQDVYAPLLAYHPTAPQTIAARETVLSRLRSVTPTFWSPERGTFREAASPADHVWYNIPFHVTMARAALSGEKETRDLCLKSADALMRLAADTHDTFRRADLGNSAPEMPGTYLLFMMQCYALDPQPKYLEEAKRIAAGLSKWTLDGTHEIYWTAMTCEGLARLYAITKDRTYVRTSLIPLARLLRNAWLWECDYGPARGWNTFGGLNADASGIDYIAAMEQYQCWYSLREYYRLTEGVLPPYAALLVSELIRYIPMTVWYAYPSHLPPESLQQGESFWKTTNRYDLAIPLEDLNDGWRKNGAVGQELYGAGACFAFVGESYVPVPGSGCTVFSEYPLLSTSWNASNNVLTLRLGGSARYRSKIEIRGRTGAASATSSPQTTPKTLTKQQALTLPLIMTAAPGQGVRLEAPGDSVVTIRFAPSAAKLSDNLRLGQSRQ